MVEPYQAPKRSGRKRQRVKKPPIVSPSRLVGLAYQVAELRDRLPSITTRITETVETNQILFSQFAKEIAIINVERHEVSSRIAVMEAAIKQLQERGLIFWLTIFGAIITALQQLLTLLKMARERWQKEPTAAAP